MDYQAGTQYLLYCYHNLQSWYILPQGQPFCQFRSAYHSWQVQFLFCRHQQLYFYRPAPHRQYPENYSNKDCQDQQSALYREKSLQNPGISDS